MSVMAPSSLLSLTLPRWQTSPCPYQRSCCPIECCATGAPLLTTVTLPRVPGRRLSAESNVCLLGRVILITAAGWSWTWPCICMPKWKLGATCVTSGTNWASTKGMGIMGGLWGNNVVVSVLLLHKYQAASVALSRSCLLNPPNCFRKEKAQPTLCTCSIYLHSVIIC